jgi:hypothetical protein
MDTGKAIEFQANKTKLTQLSSSATEMAQSSSKTDLDQNPLFFCASDTRDPHSNNLNFLVLILSTTYASHDLML